MKYQYGAEGFIEFLKTGVLRARKISKLNDPLEFHPKNSHLPWIKVMLDEIGERFCSFSFTEDPLNYLMWSYYAQGHTGICIGFDFSTPVFADMIAANKRMFPDSTDGFFKVDYSRTSRLDFDIRDFAPGSNQVEALRYFGKLAKHKGLHWEHEGEHRLLHCQFDENIQGLTATVDSDYFYFDVGFESVKEVLIGVNADEDKESEIEDIRSATGGSYSIRRVQVSATNYELK